MDRKEYQKAFDSLSFSADFQQRTADLLRQRAREQEKEPKTMKFHMIRKSTVMAAAAALLVVSVSAAALWLSPAQVANHLNEPALAQAFESTDAVLLNQTVQTGDYSVTLAGLVSGAGLTSFRPDVDASRTYAVVVLSRLDGTPLEDGTFDFIRYTLTPLVSGYAPWAVNNWTLGSSATGFAKDGAYYYLLDTQDLGMFADRTVYLAFYEGGAPSRDTFTMDQDGAIAFADSYTGPQALFTLPLDESLANPAAVQAFLDSTGMDASYAEGVEDTDFSIQEHDIPDGKKIEILPDGTEGLN